MAFSHSAPFIVAIGGTTRPNSSTERALRCTLQIAEQNGARTRLFDGPFLTSLPIYNPEVLDRNDAEQRLLETVRQADAIIIATPGYHGGVAGLIKNAIDLLEDTANDERVYFDRMPVGLIVAAYGWQATGSTMSALRSIVHAMRGWPTALGVAINSLETRFEDDGRCSDQGVVEQMTMLVDQLLWFVDGRSRPKGD